MKFLKKKCYCGCEQELSVHILNYQRRYQRRYYQKYKRTKTNRVIDNLDLKGYYNNRISKLKSNHKLIVSDLKKSIKKRYHINTNSYASMLNICRKYTKDIATHNCYNENKVIAIQVKRDRYIWKLVKRGYLIKGVQ